MKAAIAWFLLKQSVKYLRDHPDAIPGHVDDTLIRWIAGALGV